MKLSMLSLSNSSSVDASRTKLLIAIVVGVAGALIIAETTRRRRRRSLQDPLSIKDFGAFLDRFEIIPSPQPPPPAAKLQLAGLTFAVSDNFDVKGFVSGFGNPDWERTHEEARRTATSVSLVLKNGAKCVGRTVMDEFAFGFTGENLHYGTPVNPKMPSHIPGGSSSGSAVAVAAELVDFALGTDTVGCVRRIPASYCGVFVFRPSHGDISTIGVLTNSQSSDTMNVKSYFRRGSAREMLMCYKEAAQDSPRKLDEQPGWLRGGKLRDYQLDGLNFLVNMYFYLCIIVICPLQPTAHFSLITRLLCIPHNWRNDTNVILADEMSLGKTVQSVSMLGFLQNAQQIHVTLLVVVPLSTLSNWAKEFRKWLPDMNIVVYVGNHAIRDAPRLTMDDQRSSLDTDGPLSWKEWAAIGGLILFFIGGPIAYVWWKFRQQHNAGSVRPPGGIEMKVIRKLPKISFTPPSTDEAVECPICLGEYENGEMLTELPCKHSYHTGCISQHLEKKAECPLCRSVVTGRS